MTSVLLADFQYLTRQGIASLIKAMPGFELIKTIDSSEKLIAEATDSNPNLIVIDISDKDRELIPILRTMKESLQSSFLVIFIITSTCNSC